MGFHNKNTIKPEDKGLCSGELVWGTMRRRRFVFIGIIVLTVLLGVIAWSSTVFCNFYVKHIYPIWENTLGRFSNLFPFSFGGCMIVAGIAMVVLAILLPFFLIFKRFRKGIKKYYIFFAWTLNILVMVLMLNSVINYHASTIAEMYFQDTADEYSLAYMVSIRNYAVEKCNAYAKEMVRDENGEVLYGSVAEEYLRTGVLPKNAKTIMDDEIGDKVVECMKNLGKSYPQLSGFYPTPKRLFFSDIVSQEYVSGKFFPFSMEANYNTVMYIMNKPFTMCHELSHVKGFRYEDEANFIGFMACVESDDPVFQYSAYLSILYYLDQDISKAKKSSPGEYYRVLEEQPLVKISKQVKADDVFLTEKEWERINGKAIVKTETIQAVSEKVIDANLKMNGVEDGAISYSQVVELVMRYYESKGWK